MGAALGWLLAPAGDQRLGLGIGGGTGALVGAAWRWLWLKRSSVSEAPSALGHVGQAGYAIALVFCLAALWFPVKAWSEHPEKWLLAVPGLLFFGGGAFALVVLWQADREVTLSQTREARRTMALGICSVVLGLASALLAVIDSPVVGAVGALFFGLGGLGLIRRGLSGRQSRSE